jgi:hypothetical protein
METRQPERKKSQNYIQLTSAEIVRIMEEHTGEKLKGIDVFPFHEVDEMTFSKRSDQPTVRLYIDRNKIKEDNLKK